MASSVLGVNSMFCTATAVIYNRVDVLSIHRDGTDIDITVCHLVKCTWTFTVYPLHKEYRTKIEIAHP